MKKIKVGSDFSGVGAFNQALKRLDIDYEEVFACDMDKYARQTFIHNYGEPNYYPTNVYEREIPTESLDIYMTSPPCQAFSLAGNRKGESDERGVLFYNSHEFIKKNQPRFFIFENVKGLLSDDKGKTFQTWLEYLGGKSINGQTTIFKDENAVDYHIYWQVLNAKNYGVPQNRERVFIIGIRDDQDNNFRFPKPFPLEKRLKDVLEHEVDEKYYLSDNQIQSMQVSKFEHSNRIHDVNKVSPTLTTMQGGGQEPKIKVKSAILKSYELAEIIKIGEVNKGQSGSVYDINGVSTTLCAQGGGGGAKTGLYMVEHRSDEGIRFFKDECSGSIRAKDSGGFKSIVHDYSVRKLTPRECFRLMDFPDSFDFSVVSDSQAYKQAGNSIVVNVLVEILKKLPL